MSDYEESMPDTTNQQKLCKDCVFYYRSWGISAFFDAIGSVIGGPNEETEIHQCSFERALVENVVTGGFNEVVKPRSARLARGTGYYGDCGPTGKQFVRK